MHIRMFTRGLDVIHTCALVEVICTVKSIYTRIVISFSHYYIIFQKQINL